MRLARVAQAEGVSFVSVHGDGAGATAREILAHPFGTPEYSGREWPIGETRLLAPILPSKVVGFGRTYAEHAEEMGHPLPTAPVTFLKPSTAVIGPGAAIVKPAGVQELSYEGELAVVIGRPCRNVAAEDASSVILGYTIGNDVTARDLQRSELQWARAKGCDTFCPLGPWIETEFEPTDALLATEVNGQVCQDGNIADLLWSVAEQIEWISACMTLLPGDVILTGTPPGVGPLEPGDTVTVSIEGIGTLSNPVAAAR